MLSNAQRALLHNQRHHLVAFSELPDDQEAMEFMEASGDPFIRALQYAAEALFHSGHAKAAGHEKAAAAFALEPEVGKARHHLRAHHQAGSGFIHWVKKAAGKVGNAFKTAGKAVLPYLKDAGQALLPLAGEALGGLASVIPGVGAIAAPLVSAGVNKLGESLLSKI